MGTRKRSLEEVLEKANKVHNYKYDYSLITEYKNNSTKYPIICHEKDKDGNEHGVFFVDFSHHIDRGHACTKCSGHIRYTRETFINKAKEKHGELFDYSKVEYVDSMTKVCIICKKHGEFWMTPHDHLSGQGCPKCRYDKIASKRRLTIDEVIKSFKKVHGDKYDYSLITEYKNNSQKLPIICPDHGLFWMSHNNHVAGKDCPVCGKKKLVDFHKSRRLSNEEVKKRIIAAHGDKYIIPDDMGYTCNMSKIKLICPKHGEFYSCACNVWSGHGCPKCNSSKLEESVREFLTANNIKFKEQYWDKWLVRQHLDFYLPDQNIAIECQGEQHFTPVDFNGNGIEYATKAFDYTIKKDYEKWEKCSNNGVMLLYYINNKYADENKSELYTTENTFSDLNALLTKIKSRS